MTSKNPFLDADFRDFMDPAKLSERFKMTSFDPTAMTEMHRKNIEAIAEANRICFEGMQALGQRQAEIMRQSLEEAVAALKDMSAQPPAPEAQVQKQTALLKKQYEAALANMKELSEINTKSSNEAAETLTKRVSECLDEIAKTLADMGKAK
jgi:phasin family protein